MRRAIVVLAGLQAACVTIAAPFSLPDRVPGAPLPVEYFAQDRRYFDTTLSPDGRYLAVIADVAGASRLIFLNASSLVSLYTVGFSRGDRIQSYAWTSNERVLIELAERDGSYDTPALLGQIYAVDFDGSNGKLVFGGSEEEVRRNSRKKRKKRDRVFGETLDALPEIADRALIVAEPFSIEGEGVKNQPAQLHMIEVQDGEVSPAEKLPGPITSSPLGHYLADARGVLRFAVAIESSVARLYERKNVNDRWTPLAGTGTISEDLRLVCLASDANALYYTDVDERGLESVYVLDLASHSRRLLSRHARVSPSRIARDPSGRVYGVLYEPDHPQWALFPNESPWASTLERLQNTFQGERVEITSITRDGKKAVLRTSSGRNPGTYFVLDAESSSIRILFSELEGIEAAEMAKVEAFRMHASDGVELGGYVTLPPGVPPSKLPMIVVPHGGPASRDRWDFHPEAQLFASRGYLVLQVNFRGSSGFGRALQEAGTGEWGGKVQQDIIDATHWAISTGLADPERICISGASFGGYSALQSAVLAPDLFRCAAGNSGVYDLELLLVGDPDDPEGRRELVNQWAGPTEEARRAASPAHRAAELNAAVFLSHGQADQRVPITQARYMRKALIAAGKGLQAYVEPDEGHGFVDPAHRTILYRRLLAFFETHTAATPVASASK